MNIHLRECAEYIWLCVFILRFDNLTGSVGNMTKEINASGREIKKLVLFFQVAHIAEIVNSRGIMKYSWLVFDISGKG